MDIENQVCTLEQSLKLKELGVAQEGAFIWWCTERLGNKSWSLDPPDLPIKDEVSSFTVAELGEMLPPGFDTLKITTAYPKSKWVGYDHDSNPYPNEEYEYHTEAQARAAMLIKIIETGFDTVARINQRLTT